MKTKKGYYIGLATVALMAFTDHALAQTPTNDSQPKSLTHALLSCLIFAVTGMAAVFAAIVVFDKATPRIDIQKELLNHNVAVAILTGAVVIGVSLIVAASIMG